MHFSHALLGKQQFAGSSYAHYAPLAEFWFLTGCRPSKSIGLQWKHISDPIKPNTTPYSCRDTFITTQILRGIPETAISEWCDTSVEMIQKHYADFLKLLSIRPID